MTEQQLDELDRMSAEVCTMLLAIDVEALDDAESAELLGFMAGFGRDLEAARISLLRPAAELDRATSGVAPGLAL